MQVQYPLVFIYFSGRGKLQPVRNLVAYLGCKFYQIHLNNEETKKNMPQNVRNTLKGMKIDTNALPTLVHKGNLVSDTYPIISYICRNFCPDLFGKSIRQRARVTQLLENIILKQQSINSEVFAFLQGTVSKTREQIVKEKMQLYQKLMENSGFIKQMCEYIEKQQKQNTFILEDPTILDLYFMQICLRTVGIFKDLQEKKFCAIQFFFKGIFNCDQKRNQSNNVMHISTMRKYLNFTQNLPFYKDNKSYLEQYSLICPKFSKKTVEGFHKIWSEDSIFIK